MYIYICSFVCKSLFLLVICMICVLPLGVIIDDIYGLPLKQRVRFVSLECAVAIFMSETVKFVALPD